MSGARPESAAADIQHRVVLLGASNLARGIATALQTARALCNGPFDLMAAPGHGRSYGRGTMVLGRWLPGILECQLWQDLQEREGLPIRAVITDVGNDVLFGTNPEKISQWVRTCIERLKGREARVVVTGIPLTSLARMSRWEFPVLRSIFYPFCRLSFDDAQGRARKLDEHLRRVAEQTNTPFITPDGDWYARDRIHIARGHQAFAWRQFFSPLAESPLSECHAGTMREFIRVRSLTPYHRRVFGISQGRGQPAATLRDGTRVSLY